MEFQIFNNITRCWAKSFAGFMLNQGYQLSLEKVWYWLVLGIFSEYNISTTTNANKNLFKSW